MNNEKQVTQTNNEADSQVKFWGTLALAGLLLAVCVYFLTVFFRQPSSPVIYIAMAVFLLVMAMAVTSIVLVMRRRQEPAAAFVFYALFIVGILNVTIFQGRTLASSLSILVISGIMIRWMLPIRSWRRNAVIATVAFLLIWVIEWINPLWRIQLEAASVGPVVVAVLGIILATIVAVTVWRRGNLGSKLIVTFLAVTLIPLAIIAYINNNASRQALTTEANDKLGGAAEQTVAILDEFIASEIRSIRTDAQFAAVVDYVSLLPSQRANSPEEDRLQRYLAGAARRDPVYLVSIAILDKDGKTLADTEANNVGLDRSERLYYQDVLRTNAPYASDLEYDTLTKKPSLYFSAPIHNAAGSIIGVIRYRYDAAILMEYIVAQKGLVGAGSFAVLLDEYDMRLAHAANPELVFKLVTPLEPALTVDLQSKRLLPPGTTEEIATNREDFKTGLDNADTQPYFVADLTGEGDPEQVAVASMRTQNWKVAFAIPQTEFLAPINTQARNNILLTLGIGILVAAFGLFVSRTLSGPIVRLTQTAETIAGGDINIQAQVETNDEIGVLAGTFNRMTQQLRDFITTLESRVAERTRNLELAAEVGRTVSQVRALDVMLTDAAEIIRQQFNLYYVQVYLVNASQTYLDLQAGTGEVGKQLLSRNHRLPFNTNSINGRAAIEKKSVVISDTAKSPTFKSNPLLPDTRSEMAVPLIVGDRVVGVLDMQSAQGGALDKDVLPAFEALAGQVAIAIQNANFLAETNQARAEVEAQARRLTRTNWKDYLDAINKPEQTGYVFEHNQLLPLAQAETTTSENALVAPISVTGEEIGGLAVEIAGESPVARTDELLNTVARQVAQQIENLRLLDSAERYRAEAEEASRRLTREGWLTYSENANESLSYLYDLNEVKPYHGNGNQDVQGLVTLPLNVRDETVGKLVIQGLETDDNDSMSLASAVAERLGVHIESLRQFDETRRGQIELDKRAQQLAAVAEISTSSSKELNIAKMLESVVFLTQRKFGLYHAHVFTFNENSQMLEIQACGWKEGDEHEGTHGTTTIPLMQEQSLVARAARTRLPVIVNDVRNEPGWLPNPMLPDTASELAVPLLVGDQLLGVMDVQSDRLNAFTDEDASIQTTLASQVATALQNARSFAFAQKQAERESTLNTISQKIQSATTVEAVLQIAARELGHALGAPMTIAQLSMKDKK